MPDLSFQTTGLHTSFPIEDLRFAMSWSRLAPGFGGWQLGVSEMASGEMIEVTPPGAEFPVFYVLPRANGVEVIRERVMEVGGGQVSVALVPTLRDAVLLLCPLGPEAMAEASQAMRQDMFAL